MFTDGVSVSVVLLITALSLNRCSALTIIVTPDTYTEQSSGFANISCLLDDQENDVKSIFTIEILRNDQEPLVYLQASGLSYGSGVTDRLKFQAKGLINTADVYKSYLRLAILEPRKQDGGQFTCKLTYADGMGNPKEHLSSTNFTVQKMDVNKLVTQLLGQVTSLQRQLDVQAATVSKLTDSNRDLTQQMADKVSKLTQQMADKDSRISSLEAKAWIQSEDLAKRVTRLDVMTWNLTQGLADSVNNSQELANRIRELDGFSGNLSDQLTDLKETVKYAVAFSAAKTSDVEFTEGQTVVFETVILNEGKGYDGSTGLFTTPRGGYYAFHATLETSCAECAVRAIVKVDGTTVAGIFSYDKDYLEQASNSFVTHLAKGAIVSVESYRITKVYGSSLKFSLFSGYLVRAD